MSERKFGLFLLAVAAVWAAVNIAAWNDIRTRTHTTCPLIGTVPTPDGERIPPPGVPAAP